MTMRAHQLTGPPEIFSQTKHSLTIFFKSNRHMNEVTTKAAPNLSVQYELEDLFERFRETGIDVHQRFAVYFPVTRMSGGPGSIEAKSEITFSNVLGLISLAPFFSGRFGKSVGSSFSPGVAEIALRVEPIKLCIGGSVDNSCVVISSDTSDSTSPNDINVAFTCGQYEYRNLRSTPVSLMKLLALLVEAATNDLREFVIDPNGLWEDPDAHLRKFRPVADRQIETSESKEAD